MRSSLFIAILFVSLNAVASSVPKNLGCARLKSTLKDMEVVIKGELGYNTRISPSKYLELMASVNSSISTYCSDPTTSSRESFVRMFSNSISPLIEKCDGASSQNDCVNVFSLMSAETLGVFDGAMEVEKLLAPSECGASVSDTDRGSLKESSSVGRESSPAPQASNQ